MANGNHQQGSNTGQPGGRRSGGQGGSHQPPSGGGGSDITDQLTEGWGTGASDVDELVDNVKFVFDRVKGPILFAWFAVAVVSLLMSEFVASIEAVLHLAIGDLSGLVVVPFDIMVSIAVFVLGGLQIAMYGPLRAAVFEGESFDGWMDVVKRSVNRWMWVILAWIGMLVGQLVVCCLPFVVLIVLSSTPYIVATRPELPLGDAFKLAFGWFKRHFIVVLATFAVTIGGLLVLSCPMGGVVWLTSNLPTAIEPLLSTFVIWTMSTAFGLLMFIVIGSAFMTIDAHETGVEFGARTGGSSAGSSGGAPESTTEKEW